MRKSCILIAMLATFHALGTAQESAQYQTWMKSVPSYVGTVRKAADNAADKAAASTAAAMLATIFDAVAAFWKARKADDAVKFAETARDAAQALAVGSGDRADNLRTLQGTCAGCHSAHREGAAPNFKIK